MAPAIALNRPAVKRPGDTRRTRRAVHCRAEPWNALSLPTWAIHTSSVFEYLLAAGLVFRLGAQWRSLPFAMLFLHCSSLCACTYHLFYNSSEVQPLVLLQAALTFFGNIALAVAARSLALENEQQSAQSKEPDISEREEVSRAVELGKQNLPGVEDLSDYIIQQPAPLVVAETVVISFVSAAVVKYGELLFDWPQQAPSMTLALPIVLLPTFLNGLKFTLMRFGRASTPAQSSGKSG